MTESNVHKAERELAEAQKLQTNLLTVKEGINTAVEQALWIALMIDFAAISGKIVKKDNLFLWEQREQLAALLTALTDPTFKGPVGVGEIPNPVSYLFRVFKPLIRELMAKDSEQNYARMAPIPAMIMVFVIPGLMRMIGNQVGGIIPG